VQGSGGGQGAERRKLEVFSSMVIVELVKNFSDHFDRIAHQREPIRAKWDSFVNNMHASGVRRSNAAL